MAVSATPTSSPPTQPMPSGPSADHAWTSHPVTAWMPLAVSLLAAAAVGFFILMPFYGNGLHHLPLDQVAGGAYDPKDLWPIASDSFWAGFFRLGGFLAFLGAPLLAGAAGVVGAYAAWRDRRVLSRWVPQLSAVAVAVVLFWWLGSDMGTAVMTWFMD